jgi:serine protease Do
MYHRIYHTKRMTADSRSAITRYILIAAIILLFIGGIVSSGIFGLHWSSFGRFFPAYSLKNTINEGTQTTRIVSEESVVIDVVNKASPSVVTVGIINPQTSSSSQDNVFQFDPFNMFTIPVPRGSLQPNTEQDIGSGFIVGADGLIVTNKHVVADTTVQYKVITKDNKSYTVSKIYRDPSNDLAILKIDPPTGGLPTVVLGDSSKIKVGQLAIAIGTALGEFRSTVTTGVVSGVGRGITAGDPLAGEAETLDNVIQTSAAINPGNSGGPLLNSSGQVVGINVAVSQQGQNIGFALPVNVVKDALNNFNATGQFNRPYLGVRYKTITKDVALLNEVPEGAYIMDVVSGSPADKSGVKTQDIITKIDGTRLSGGNELSTVVGKKAVGDTTSLTVYRGNKEQTIKVTLGNQSDQ